MFWGGVKGGHNFLSLFHVLDNFKNKIFEKKIGMTKIDRHFLLLYEVICFTLYTREIARNHLLYFLACKCVIYFRMTYLIDRSFFSILLVNCVYGGYTTTSLLAVVVENCLVSLHCLFMLVPCIDGNALLQ